MYGIVIREPVSCLDLRGLITIEGKGKGHVGVLWEKRYIVSPAVKNGKGILSKFKVNIRKKIRIQD